MDDELLTHDYKTLIGLMQSPVPNYDLIFFCDGSVMRPSDTQYLPGYAVAAEAGVVEAHVSSHI